MSIQIKGYKYRIYPTKEQEIQLVKTIGYVRFVFNQLCRISVVIVRYKEYIHNKFKICV